jgi:hypothetical protein
VKITIKTERGESIVRYSYTGSTRSGWRTLGQVAVAAGPNWAAANCGHERKVRSAGPAAGNWPERELGDRKTFSFIKTPLYFQTYLIKNLNLNFA